MTTQPSTNLTVSDLARARDLFRARIDSLTHDVKRCFWPINEPGAPGPAFFPAAMYALATLDYFSSFWAGWNAPNGQDQTIRMTDFAELYLLYPRKESQIAIHFWRHKLMHTAEPRVLRDADTNDSYLWSTSTEKRDHMQLVPETAPATFRLHFNPSIFDRDLRDGVFGANGYFLDLRKDTALQSKYQKCLQEFKEYKIKIKP